MTMDQPKFISCFGNEPTPDDAKIEIVSESEHVKVAVVGYRPSTMPPEEYERMMECVRTAFPPGMLEKAWNDMHDPNSKLNQDMRAMYNSPEFLQGSGKWLFSGQFTGC